MYEIIVILINYNSEIENLKIKCTFDYFYNKKYTEKEAIDLIKNIILIHYYVTLYRTDYFTYFGRVLLKAANFIEGDENLNFKILKALFKSQFNEIGTKFRDEAKKEILLEIDERLKCLYEKEKSGEYFYLIKNSYKRLLSEENRFDIEYFSDTD
ncbi:hypothetical protein PIROE2DRAFT_14432 [Piromyces sp. E2]|nr:hypothetical protein PIROE2DRAFT_14432 [Piromyces sp. E2]|eukprot:OUM59909.1 hypothetical protein PIROE2DRAFT_14432 [Piromyces sp. E2]